MIFGTKDKVIYEYFSITDGSNNLVPGIAPTAFTVDLFNPSGQEISSQINVDVIELGAGHYRAGFIPNEVGVWYLVVYHNQYFPWGKSDDISVYNSDFDMIASDLARTLGLTQENYYLDNTEYTEYQGATLLTSGRLRIYSDASSVGTSSDVIAVYQITSTWSGDELETYKVVKI